MITSHGNNRIALGTVQFGLPYGIANQTGQIDRGEAAAILNHALSAGIDTLDTAIGYGDSEQRLGEIGVEQWKVITKLPAVPESCANVEAWVRDAVAGSLERLGIRELRGLLLHCPQQLHSPVGDRIYRSLIELKEQGLIEKIGVSIYGPEELDALDPGFRFDLVQAPFNIVDRRLAASGWLARLQRDGTEVHVRSVFLQGLLLMDGTGRPPQFSRWQPLWDRWQRWLDDHHATPLQACLGFVLTHPGIDRVVVGVDSLKQLQQILSSVETPALEPPPGLISDDLSLINPSRWDAL